MLRVFDYNHRAIRAYEKCGFQHEGAMRQAHFADSAYHDELIMGILREEYLAHE
jgi:RimJ/RimL family protein N-acetyltransferase